MRSHLFALLIAGLVILLSPPALAATIVGTITDTTNAVQYQRSGSTKWLEAESGTKLYNNDKIRTLANSKATLTLDDGKNIHIPQRTTMTVTADSNKVTLDIGKGIYKFVKGKDVKPSAGPVATAGVMGLQDSSSSSEEVLQVENPDGNVMSLKEDGSVVDPNAASNLNNTTGSSGNSNGKVNPNSAKEDVKSGVDEIQQDVQNKVKDEVKENLMKGLFGK